MYYIIILNTAASAKVMHIEHNRIANNIEVSRLLQPYSGVCWCMFASSVDYIIMGQEVYQWHSFPSFAIFDWEQKKRRQQVIWEGTHVSILLHLSIYILKVPHDIGPEHMKSFTEGGDVVGKYFRATLSLSNWKQPQLESIAFLPKSQGS